MRFKFPPPRPVLGIDIGHSAVKAVAITRHGRACTPCIDGFAITPLDAHDQAALTAAIQTAHAQAAPRARDAGAAISSAAAIAGSLCVAKDTAPAALSAQVALALDKQLQQPTDQLAFDYRCQPPSSSEPTTQQVEFMASHRSSVNERAALLKAAGLCCRLIDVEHLALARTLQMLPRFRESAAEVIGMIDIGARQLHLSVLAGAHLIDHYSYPCRAQDVQSEPTLVADQALALYQSRHPEHPIGSIYCAGGRANSGLINALRERTSSDVQPLDPIAAIGTAEHLDPAQLKRDLAQLLTALGLALHLGDPHAHWR